MNRGLRRALADADLTEVDVAAHLDVDPKAVRAWISGRVPYPHARHRCWEAAIVIAHLRRRA